LRAAIARISDRSAEWNGSQSFQLARGFGNQQTDFPVTGVKSKRDGSAIIGSCSTMCAENQDLRTTELVGRPTHSDIQAETKDVSRWLVDQHVGSDGQLSCWTRCMGGDVVENAVCVLQD
jgi:hypothetical protein